MTRSHDVGQLTTAELERAKRELQANLGLINPDSPAHVPIQAHMQAIDTELAERAGSRRPAGTSATTTKDLPVRRSLTARRAGSRNTQKPPARAGLDTARAGPDTAHDISE